ncbi:hypothetical protein [Microbacterium hominis]|uniref:Uncharacterized protein n=1 Tax=Microbacterium hominis TaxID=162426 RepID=A0A0B4CUN7_9MICO|nr:hypothetical protein [Microbacterium hominis]KIC60137.1 hypothetical protein RM52_01695 [Microbacterium hominis]
MMSQRTWTDRIGSVSARLRLVYVGSWLAAVCVIGVAVVWALTGTLPRSGPAVLIFVIITLVLALGLLTVRAIVERALAKRIAADLSVPRGRTVPVRLLLNKRDFDRWVTSLR